MTTTPSREDWDKIAKEWRDEFWSDYYKTGSLTYIEEDGSDRANVEHITNWWLYRINNLLKSHNNALVAEIEKLIEKSTPPEHCGRMGKGQKCESCAEMNGRVRALDTIIRIIQEK